MKKEKKDIEERIKIQNDEIRELRKNSNNLSEKEKVNDEQLKDKLKEMN